MIYEEFDEQAEEKQAKVYRKEREDAINKRDEYKRKRGSKERMIEHKDWILLLRT